MADSNNNDGDNKVTADSYGKVHLQDVEKECWMLRVPPKLALAWDALPEGSVLGELVFKKGGKLPNNQGVVKPNLQVHVAPHVRTAGSSSGGGDASATASTTPSTLPLQYSLQAMTKKLPTLHPMTRHPNGSVSIHGTVTRTANLQVHQDANYRQLCKTRILQTTVHNSRYVKPVESNQVVQQSKRKVSTTTGGGSFGEAVHQFGKKLLETANQPSPNKKAKFDVDQPTKSVIFQLFSQQQYWTVKDLKVASGGRPENEIRDTLREIGDYHRSGDNKNTWELRKEFQNKSLVGSA